MLLDDLHCKNRDVNVVMLCETYLNKHNVDFGNLEGYQSFHALHELKIGRGITILVRDGVKVNKVVLQYVGDCTECLLIETVINKKFFSVGCIYRIPNTDLKQFFDDLKGIVNKVKKYSNVIIGADQNLDLLKVNHHGATGNFYDVLLQAEWKLTTKVDG